VKILKKFLMIFTVSICTFAFTNSTASAASNSKYVNTPYGKLTSNAWRSGLTISGNTYQFNYQTSAVYSGSKKVEWIRTSWEVCASLRNNASITIGISSSGGTAGSSSSWQNICKSAYWYNSNGAKGAYSERRNSTIKPRKDYRNGTVSVQNEAKVRIKGDARSWSVNASV